MEHLGQELDAAVDQFGPDVGATHVGALLGYDSSKESTRRKVPSSNGVSAGPKMTAFHSSKLSGHGAPLTLPAGIIALSGVGGPKMADRHDALARLQHDHSSKSAR